MGHFLEPAGLVGSYSTRVDRDCDSGSLYCSRSRNSSYQFWTMRITPARRYSTFHNVFGILKYF